VSALITASQVPKDARFNSLLLPAVTSVRRCRVLDTLDRRSYPKRPALDDILKPCQMRPSLGGQSPSRCHFWDRRPPVHTWSLACSADSSSSGRSGGYTHAREADPRSVCRPPLRMRFKSRRSSARWPSTPFWAYLRR